MAVGELVSPCVEQLIAWFWEHGIKRVDRFALPIGGWLDRVYQARNTLRQLNKTRDQGTAGPASSGAKKACVAVWGPSQSGKSTLISSYIDKGANEVGAGSALHWPGGPPARFVAAQNCPEGTISLNPYNWGADASACVSRFVLVSDADMKDPTHTVEIRIASPAEVRHALAAGYVSECLATNDKQETVVLDADRFLSKLDALGVRGAGAVANQTAFEELHALADVLELLIRSKVPRYDNLNAGGQWDKSLRRSLLECPALLSSVDAVQRFSADILWDGKEALTRVYLDLSRKSMDLSRRWPGKRVYCSMAVASLLLDMDSYVLLVLSDEDEPREGGRQRADQVRNTVAALSWKEEGDRVLIGVGHPHRLIDKNWDFGLIQALVWELVIPLRAKSVLEASPAFHEFLKSADLLDFPGVALAHENAEQTLIDVTSIPEQKKYKLVTEVFKRGKTASIVASYSKNLNIDAFALLVRLGKYPAQPRQLHSGITTWWRSMDPAFDPLGTRFTPPLPLNLVLTFFGAVVSDVVRNPGGPGLHRVFDTMLGKLGILADPRVVKTFATTYPQFRDGALDGSASDLETARDRIQHDATFQRLFNSRESTDSFASMFDPAGGTDFLFESLQKQAQSTNRGVLLKRREDDCVDTLLAQIELALPGATNQVERRNAVLKSMFEEIEKRLQDLEQEGGVPDSAMYIGSMLRNFLNVDPESLDALPHNAMHGGANISKYVREQYLKWVGRPRNTAEIEKIGFANPAAATQFLHYLVDGVRIPDLVTWIKQNFGFIDSQTKARVNRRHLAVAMSSAIFYGSKAARTHLGFTENRAAEAPGVLELLNCFSDHEQEKEPTEQYRYQDSPHYIGFILPFYDMMLRIKDTGIADRPTQPGDAELRPLSDRVHAMVVEAGHR